MYKQKFTGKRVIVGVDQCQRLSGVAFKLAAFEKLLTDYSNIQGDYLIVFLFI
jgi:trehalose-6-phosphate synthase